MMIEEEDLLVNTAKFANGDLINVDVFLSDFYLGEGMEFLDCFDVFVPTPIPDDPEILAAVERIKKMTDGKVDVSEISYSECLFLVKWTDYHRVGGGKVLWRSDG